MMSHINSYPRPIMNGKTPYDAFAFMFGEDILLELGLVRIDAADVILKPWLLED